MNNELSKSQRPVDNEAGFTLIETVIALVILLIAVLGVFGAFTYAVRFNTGNSARSQALSVLQREVESLRSAKFTPTITDSTPANIDLTGGVKTRRTVIADNGTGATYSVDTTIDDDPFTAGVQTNAATTMKEITITVTPQGVDTVNGNANSSFVTAFPTRAIFRRVRSN
jgi:prepilin-type N-terminal cleavage/methylation domain-containing protein